MSNSFACYAPEGAGYCTFRYQEIPAVGSMIVAPDSPWVVRNDYENGKTCVKYKRPSDILKMSDISRLNDIRMAGIEHFRRYHTVDVRYREFMEYLGEVRRD